MSDARRRLAVVGNGMAGSRLLEELVRHDTDWAVAVFGDEPHPAYDRIALSRVLAGSRAVSDVLLKGVDWYERNGIELHTGCRVLALDAARRELRTAGGTFPFDACVLATGSLPVVPPIPGAELDGVMAFRTLDEVQEMIRRSEHGRRAVVVGGGLLGLEAARGLLERGMEVTVVHLMDRLMERQLDHGAGGLLRSELERIGMNVVLPASTERISGDGRVEEVVLADGVRLPADLVVICAGIKPNTELAAAAELEVGRGVVVDDRMTTSQPAVFAIGECVEHRGTTFGLVAPLYEQAAVLARVLAGDASAAFEPLVSATQLKVAGVDVFAGGRTVAEPGDDEVLLRDDANGVYKKLVLREDRVVGVALLGDLRSMAEAGEALARGAKVGDRLSLLGVGQEQDAELPGAGLPDAAIVCGCNGVSKAAILAAIRREGGCNTRDCVGRCTRASTFWPK